jgi:hypothetical protein
VKKYERQSISEDAGMKSDKAQMSFVKRKSSGNIAQKSDMVQRGGMISLKEWIGNMGFGV